MSWWMWLILILVVLGAIGSNKEKEEKKQKLADIERRRQEAEDYIMKSRDQEAIKQLMLARANPANYGQVMASGMNAGNDTLKTAMGVMTGVVAGNMISNAITASAIQSAFEDMNKELKTLSTDLASADDLDIDGDDIDLDLG